MRRLHLKTFNSGIFLFLIFATGILSLQGIYLPESNLKRFLSGHTFRHIEDHYQETFPQKEWATGLWAAINYQLFNEGRPGVVVGRNGWLFSTEEYNLPADHQKQLRKNLAEIYRVHQLLAKEGTKLLVLLIPEKVDIYHSFQRKQSPHNEFGIYGISYEQLKNKGIDIIDLRSPLANSMQAGKQVFFRTDTHWTVTGAQIAAREIAEAGLVETGATEFTSQQLGETRHKGDLHNFIPTGSSFSRFGPPPESLSRIHFEKESSQDNLFGDVEIDTALVGTSYSGDKRWHFQEWLQMYLHQEVVNYAEKGHGPFIPMENFLAKPIHERGDLKNIIWEIPVRYLLTNPHKKEDKK